MFGAPTPYNAPVLARESQMTPKRKYTREIVEYAFSTIDASVSPHRKRELERQLDIQRSRICGRKLRASVEQAFGPAKNVVGQYLERRIWPHKHITMMLLLTLDGIHQLAESYISDSGPHYSSRSISTILKIDDPDSVSKHINDSVRKNKKKVVIDLKDGTVLRLKSTKETSGSGKAFCWSLLREQENELQEEVVQLVIFSLPPGSLTVKEFLERDDTAAIQCIVRDWAPRMIAVAGGITNTIEVFTVSQNKISLFVYHLYSGALSLVMKDKEVPSIVGLI